jgi:hypothetical protein
VRPFTSSGAPARPQRSSASRSARPCASVTPGKPRAAPMNRRPRSRGRRTPLQLRRLAGCSGFIGSAAIGAPSIRGVAPGGIARGRDARALRGGPGAATRIAQCVACECAEAAPWAEDEAVSACERVSHSISTSSELHSALSMHDEARLRRVLESAFSCSVPAARRRPRAPAR